MDHNNFSWQDRNWKGILFQNMVIFEVHVETFTREGTFEAIIPRLGDLKKSGVNALQLIPVGLFSGERNWGYDVAYHFAVQNSYVEPQGLKELVNACHHQGIAVILDVV